MKRIKGIERSTLKTTILGKGGRKRKIEKPLTVQRDSTERPTASITEQEESFLVSSPCDRPSSFRKTNAFVNWSVAREKIFSSFLMSYAMLSDANCLICHQRATIRCSECGPNQVFCRDCGTELHRDRNQFHVLELWQDDKFIPLYPDHGVLGYGHKCPTLIKKPFTLIDFYGRHHTKYVEICSCESVAATLIRLNFWPGSPEKPTVAFHISLMRLCEKFFLQCHVSLFNIVETLKSLLPPLHPTVVSSIYSILNSGCFEEFRHFQYRCKTLSDKCKILDDGSICPLCPKDNGTIIECMDACMGLTRKRSKGTHQKGQMRHGPLLFSGQDEVDDFVDNYTSDGNVDIEKDCSRFHAGEVLGSLRSKGKNKIFEEKGVFGRVCRHDYPKHFIDLKYGERISYSVYELNKLKSQFSDKNVSLIVMYDIACILEKHLKITNQANLIDNFGLAIPIFHCYGHKASCQVKYSPRRLDGVGLTDGEGVERLWSYLRDFSRMTKEMSADKRTDVLTDALLHYGEKLRKKFGMSLKGKLSRAQSLLCETDKKIKELSKSLPVSYNLQDIVQWQSEELASISPREKVLELEWQEHYVDLLLESKRLRNELVNSANENEQRVDETQRKKKRNEKALAAIEKKQRVSRRWRDNDATFQATEQSLFKKKKGNLLLKMQRISSERSFLLEMKKKYADGQSIAIKLSKQISKVTDQMKRNILSYNELAGRALKFEDVKDPCSSVYNTDSASSSFSSSTCPTSIKRQLIDLHYMKKRCEEEIDLVKREMIQLLSFHFSQINYIEEYMRSLSLTNTAEDKGLRALLGEKKLALEVNRSRLEKLWESLHISPYHWEAVMPWTFITETRTIFSKTTEQQEQSDEEELDEEGDESDGNDEYSDHNSDSEEEP